MPNTNIVWCGNQPKSFWIELGPQSTDLPSVKNILTALTQASQFEQGSMVQLPNLPPFIITQEAANYLRLAWVAQVGGGESNFLRLAKGQGERAYFGCMIIWAMLCTAASRDREIAQTCADNGELEKEE